MTAASRPTLWLLVAVALAYLALSTCMARAEPGDKYEMTFDKPHYKRSNHIGGVNDMVGGRPAICPPRAWCGCWLSIARFGKSIRHLWYGRNWLDEGQPVSEPSPGVIAIYARGRGAHVGEVRRVISPTRIVLLSGNDGGAVRERERSTAGIIGYRRL